MFNTRALRSFVHTAALSVMLAAAGCSIFAAEKTKSVALSAGPLSGNSGYQVETLDTNPYIYSLTNTNGGSGSPRTYLTLVKQCGIGKTVGPVATTRQLLVGLKDISILKQEKITHEQDRYLFSLLDARLDESSVSIACFSRKHEGCVSDLVLWTDQKEGNEIFSSLSAENGQNVQAFFRDFNNLGLK